jgi:O-antigen ligase/Flp pilus assembly protein TadD
MAGAGDSAMIAWCERAQEAVWLAAAVAVPLIFNPWGYNGFELPKAVFLRALVLIMGLATLVRLGEAWGRSDRSSYLRTCTPLLWPALLFGVALGLATAFSGNPRASLWGSYERQQGLLTLGAYLALFLLTASGLRTRAQADRLWAALVWGSAPIVVYALVQSAGLDPLGWRTDAASPVHSTVGRSNFLGSYLVLVIPLTVGRAVAADCRWPYGLLVTGQLLALALTQARGAWVGLAAAALAGALAWAVATGNRRLMLTTLATAALVAGFVLLLSLPGSPLASLSRLPALDRLAALTRTDAGSTAARLTIWRATLPLFTASPWLGYGPETMRTVFAAVFPPELVYYQGRHIAVDRAHNLWLDLGMSMGMAGIAAFGALLFVLGRLAWRGLRTDPDRWVRVTWAALAAAVVGHLADLQFSFDLTASAIVFWLTLALGASLGKGLVSPVPSRTASARPRAFLPYLLPTVAVLALLALVCLRPLLADVAYGRSQDATRPLEERQTAGVRAARLWPLEPEYRLGLAWALMQSADYPAAEVQLVAADRLSPDDPKVWAMRGELYAWWGQSDPARFLQAEEAWQRALELAPNQATYHASLGLVLSQQGRLEEGVSELERAVALDATDAVAFQHLADLYLSLGREAAAASAQREAIRWSGK